MLFLELKKILKDSILLLLVVIPLTLWILNTKNDTETAVMILKVFLILYASYTGWSMFDRERQENAMEYLLSMPISRTRLFLLKFLPRLVCVLVILGLFLAVHKYFNAIGFLQPSLFAAFYLSFFLVSVSFSLSIRNFILALFTTAFLAVGLSYYYRYFGFEITEVWSMWLANGVLGLFPVVFFLAFQKFDLRAGWSFNRRLIPPLVLIVLLALGGLLLQKRIVWQEYYITKTGDIIRSSCYNGRGQWIHTSQSSNILSEFPGSTIPLIEYQGILLFQVRSVIEPPNAHKHTQQSCLPLRISELNLKTGTQRTLMTISTGWQIDHSRAGVNGMITNGVYYNFLYNLNSNQYKIFSIDLQTPQRTVNEINIYGNLEGDQLFYLFHMQESPRQFFIMGDNHLFRVKANGATEAFAPVSRQMAAWKNHLVTFDDGIMHTYELNNQITLIGERSELIRKIRQRNYNFTSYMIFVRLKTGIHLLNMETLELKKVNLTAIPYYYTITETDSQLLWFEKNNLIYGTLVNGSPVRLGIWQLPNIQEPRIIACYPTGVIVFNPFNEYRYLCYPQNKFSK